jgi:transposase-like protein
MKISYKAACPQCGSADYRRSKRRGILERFALSLIRLLPYRCHDCNARFYNRLEPVQARR